MGDGVACIQSILELRLNRDSPPLKFASASAGRRFWLRLNRDSPPLKLHRNEDHGNTEYNKEN